MKPSLLRRTLAALVVSVVLAAPAVADADSHPVGFRGTHGVSFTVNHHERVPSVVERVSYGPFSGFEFAPVVDGSFKTCLRIHHSGTFYFHVYCIHGTFQTPEYVTGTVTRHYVLKGETHTEPTQHFEARPE